MNSHHYYPEGDTQLVVWWKAVGLAVDNEDLENLDSKLESQVVAMVSRLESGIVAVDFVDIGDPWSPDNTREARLDLLWCHCTRKRLDLESEV